MTIEHDEIQQLLGVYALDAIGDDDRRVVEPHLASCPGCRQEVDQHRGVAAMLAGGEEPAPDAVWHRLETAIRHKPDNVVRLGASRWVSALTAAAMISLVAMVSVQTLRLDAARSELDASTARLAAIETALAAGDLGAVVELAEASPDAVVVALTGDAGDSEAILLPDGTGILTRSSLAPLDTDGTYQLWAVIDGEVISAGLLGSAPDTVPFHVDPDRLEGLVVTAETAGGVAVSAQAPASAWFRQDA